MNISKLTSNKAIIIYIIKFAACFSVLYFGTVAVIGLATPQNYYSPFTAKYLNYIDWLRSSLLSASKGLLSLLGYKTYLVNKYVLYVESGGSIRMVYSCVGYGVMSFWAAFIIANKGKFFKKLYWVLGGILAIWIINVLRITILLIVLNKKLEVPLFDHHTWFNIAAYSLIFLMIYLYDRSFSESLKLKSKILK